MIIRGLLLAIDGFVFVFLPALLTPVFLRRHPEAERRYIWWGAVTFLISLLPAIFLSSLARQVLQPDDSLTGQILGASVTALINAVLVVGAQYLLLRWRKLSPALLPASGLAVGLGVGLVTQIFVGFAHVGAGLRMLFFGGASGAELAALAETPMGLLSLQLVAELVNRAALLVFSGSLGYLVGRSVGGRRGLLLWAMLLYAAFGLTFQLVQSGLAEQEVLASVASIAISGVIGAVAGYWLLGRPRSGTQSK